MKTQKTSPSLAGVLLLTVAGVAGLLTTGCSEIADAFKVGKDRWFDPSAVVESPDHSLINPIRQSVSVVDPSDELPPNATPPGPDDQVYHARDYVIGPRDIVDISILDLFSEGAETVLRRQVSESGFIDMPMVPQRIHAEGLDKEQLREAIRQAYMPDILRNPTVAVTIVQRRQNSFSILGAVGRPSTYDIYRNDMRLLEALAMAGGKSQTNIPYLYVIRPRSTSPRMAAEQTRQVLTDLPELPQIPTDAEPTQPSQTPETAPAENESEMDKALRELGEGLMPTPVTQPTSNPAPGEGEAPQLADAAPAGTSAKTLDKNVTGAGRSDKFMWVNGRWVRVSQEAEVAEKPSGQGAKPVRPLNAPAATAPTTAQQDAATADPYGWRASDQSDLARIIAINVTKLEAGDPRMNIVIRDNDTIIVPALETGEFYVVGEVLRPGVYSLTGRKITVKMAVAAAGNLSALAWPENSVLVRRVGKTQEQMVPLNIEKIFGGKEADLYLKPNDVIAVGTSWQAPFLTVFRNAFRFTYGFGFIYDRNFADPLTETPGSNRFTAW